MCIRICKTKMANRPTLLFGVYIIYVYISEAYLNIYLCQSLLKKFGLNPQQNTNSCKYIAELDFKYNPLISLYMSLGPT